MVSSNARGGRVVVGVTLGFAVLALLGLRAFSRSPPLPTVVASPAGAPLSSDAATLLAVCDHLAGEYKQAWAKLAFCQTDADCAAEERGERWSGLDGCVRVASRTAPKGPADELAGEWLSHGCSREVDACLATSGAQCRERRCVELPPAPVPRDWNRVRVPDLFTMFVPGDLAPGPAREGATIGRTLEGGGRELLVSFGPDGAGDAERAMPWVKRERREALTVSGRPTTLDRREDRGERGDAKLPWVAEATIPGVAPPWYFAVGSGALRFELRCATRALCDLAPTILGSLEVVSRRREAPPP